jgi:DNA repair protein RadD
VRLRPYQEEAIESVYAYFERKDGNPLIVMPTGTGKSVVVAELLRRFFLEDPTARFLCLTHVKELIAQNHATLRRIWPQAPSGVHSAGLRSRDTESPILFAGIQSVCKRAKEIGERHVVLVDEAHLIPREEGTRYHDFLAELRAINPDLKVIGLTATPYRLDSGLLHRGEGALFSDICFDLSIRDMIEQGWLSPLRSKATDVEIDVEGVATRGGDFVQAQLEARADAAGVTEAIAAEIVRRGRLRRGWLVFCAGVKHAKHMAAALADLGVTVGAVTQETKRQDRDALVEEFRAGRLRALVNVNVLTTGFDVPHVDLIAMCRPTQSPGLYVQMVGRGTRLAEAKRDALILDFAGNVRRHGPVDLVRPPKGSLGEETEDDEDAPELEDGGLPRLCPKCQEWNPSSVSTCRCCGSELPTVRAAPKLSTKAEDVDILSADGKTLERWYEVGYVDYFRHVKRDGSGPPSLRVQYWCGGMGQMVKEWVCLEHTGYPRRKAERWWRERMPGSAPPKTVDEALAIADSGQIPAPSGVFVRFDGRYMEVLEHRF